LATLAAALSGRISSAGERGKTCASIRSPHPRLVEPTREGVAVVLQHAPAQPGIDIRELLMRPTQPHVEGPVRAEQHPVLAEGVRHQFQRFCIVRDAIHAKPAHGLTYLLAAEIRAGSFGVLAPLQATG